MKLRASNKYLKNSNKYLFNESVNCKWYRSEISNRYNYTNQCEHPILRTRHSGIVSMHIYNFRQNLRYTFTENVTISFDYCGSLGIYYEGI